MKQRRKSAKLGESDEWFASFAKQVSESFNKLKNAHHNIEVPQQQQTKKLAKRLAPMNISTGFTMEQVRLGRDKENCKWLLECLSCNSLLATALENLLAEAPYSKEDNCTRFNDKELD